MGGTDIKETWDDYLASGEDVEEEFRKLMSITSPNAYRSGGNEKRWDICAPEIRDLKVEVKRDYLSMSTGNFGIEYRCKGEKSGIAVTTAEIFVMVDPEFFWCFHAEPLKAYLREHWTALHHRPNSGDNGNSELVLLPKRTAEGFAFLTKIPRGKQRSRLTSLQRAWLPNKIEQFLKDARNGIW